MESKVHITISAEPIFNILGIPITNSLMVAFFATLFLSIIAITYYLKSKSNPSSSFVILINLILKPFYNIQESILQENTFRIFPVVATFFFFILVANWMGLIPGFGTIGTKDAEGVFIPFLRGATADLNITLALALVSVGLVQYYGISSHKFSYFKKFINFKGPIDFFIGILETISEFAKIISFAFRLFGNIFAGEVLLVVISSLVPVIFPSAFLGMEIFVGLIQALVFSLLTAVFISMAVSHSSH